jgi:hypothetical protein
MAPLIRCHASAHGVELKLILGRSSLCQEKTMSNSTSDKKHDKAVDMTFPASDPVAPGHPTGTEEPCRPADRKAPKITRKQIEQAQRGGGHKHEENE